MELRPPIELDLRSIGDHPNEDRSDPPFQRLSELSSWMMVLGTVRLVCMLTDYVGAFAEAIRTEPFTMRALSRLSAEIHPIVAVSAAWPLILAIALRRTRWPQLLPAAAATFLVLSIGGMIELSVQWGQARGYGGMVGSFHLSRRAFLRPGMADLALGTLGATQLLLELAVAIRAFLLMPSLRSAPDDLVARQERARRARYGRIALYTSLGYLFVVIRLPVWSTYLEVLNNSTLVRNFILENDTDRSNWRRIHALRRAPMTDEEKRFNDFRYLVAVSDQDVRNGHYTEARDRYQQIIEAIDSLPDDSLPKDGRSLVARALNNLAWLEATCPQTGLRNPREAVRNARRATTLQPDEGNYWNTLGAANYRAGEWEDARIALAHSMSLRKEGDSFDWFFLSLAELKMGRAKDARKWYDKAVAWFQQSAPNDDELHRFQVEAAQELGLPGPVAHEITSKTGQIDRSLLPRSIHRLVRRRHAEGELKIPGQ